MFELRIFSLSCSIVRFGPSNVDMSEPVLDVPLKTEIKINIEGSVWEMTISNFNIEGASAQTTFIVMLE